jgi:ABC-type multidrug transport system ATPase subunit
MGQHYALIGNNGSGKSTLLQTISGYATLSKGKIDWGEYDATTIFQQISLAAPYLELIEEFTTLEQFKFHEKFKPLRKPTLHLKVMERWIIILRRVFSMITCLITCPKVLRMIL